MSKGKRKFRVVPPDGKTREWTFDKSGVVSDREVENEAGDEDSDVFVQADCSMRNGCDLSENIVFDSGKKVGGFFGRPVVIILLILLVIGLVASLWLLNKRRTEDTEFLSRVVQEERKTAELKRVREKSRVAALYRVAEKERIKLEASRSEAARLREVIEEPKRKAKTKKAKVVVDSVAYGRDRILKYRLCEKSGVSVVFDRYRLMIDKPSMPRYWIEDIVRVFDSDIMPLESSLTIEKGQCCPKLKYRPVKRYLFGNATKMVLNRKEFSLSSYRRWIKSGRRIVLMLLGEDENGHSSRVILQKIVEIRGEDFDFAPF